MKLRYCFIGSVHVQPRGINQRTFNHDHVSLLFAFHGFSLFRMKMALTYLNYDNYSVIIQNYSKTIVQNFVQVNSLSCSICCTYLWNIKVHSPLRLALKIPMTSS